LSLSPKKLRSMSGRVRRNLLTAGEFRYSKVIARKVAMTDEVQTE
jgi:hypothetical protein